MSPGIWFTVSLIAILLTPTAARFVFGQYPAEGIDLGPRPIDGHGEKPTTLKPQPLGR